MDEVTIFWFVIIGAIATGTFIGTCIIANEVRNLRERLLSYKHKNTTGKNNE